MNKIKLYTYYILIGLVSFISVSFLPMLQSEINVDYKFPQTAAAWFLWAGTRLSVSTLNILIFHCFVKQGDMNTMENENRKKAEKILQIIKEEDEEYKPQSPKSFFTHEYGKKIPMLLLTTALSLFAFAPAVLAFDLVTFMTYLFTITIALVFGILEMFRVENYYEREFLIYAEYKKNVEEIQEIALTRQKMKEKAKQDSKIKNFENKNICQYLGKKEN